VPHQHEPVAQLGDDRVSAVVGGGAGHDHAELAVPLQPGAALGADVPIPGAVEDFSKRGKDVAAPVALHADDAGEVLEHEHAVVADPAEQSAGRALGAVLGRGVPDSRAASPLRVEATTTGRRRCSAMAVSVLPVELPETSPNHTGSPARRMLAA
jgi:hypothetical protein